MENKIPKNWVECRFGDVAKIHNGYAFATKDFRRDKGVPLIKQSQLNGDKVDLTKCVYLDEIFLETKKDFVLKKGDVLIGMSGSVGKMCLYDLDFSALQNQRTGKAVPYSETLLNKKLFWYFLSTIERILLEKGKGLGVANVSADDIEDLVFNLPPLPEQHRIVAKLDAVMQKVESNKQRLEKIPKLLKRFRQSVLAAAVSGRLTNKIEDDNLPESWKIQYGKDVFEFITSGSRGWAEYYSEVGKLFIRVTNLDFDTIKINTIPDKNKYVTPPQNAEGTRTKVKVGDVLISITGDVGMVGLVENNMEEAYINQHVCLARPKKGSYSKYIAYYISAMNGGRKYFDEVKKGATKSGLVLGDIKELPIPFPPLEEQKEIVRRVEQLFAFADKIEARYSKAKNILDKLPQSILAKAFRGELVAQDPNDEPASVLLERIKAEKEKLAAEKKGKKTKAYSIEEKPLKIAAEKKVKYKKVKK